MKLSIAIAEKHALPSAFVVFRGFEEYIPKAAKYGYKGVELALKRAEEINQNDLQKLLGENNIEVSCISTGQVYADGGLTLTHEKKGSRDFVINIFKEFIDLAYKFGKTVNIGRVRGQIGKRSKLYVEELFVEVARELCEYALPKKVTLILEPVNRYEIDFINTVNEGVDLLKKVGMPNMMLMPDLFHMNIEEKDISLELVKNVEFIKYIHFADSNRFAPGQGHIDFQQIFHNLLLAGYNGWISTEILPRPDPDTAAKQTIDFLLPLIQDYNDKFIKIYKAPKIAFL
ncbi:MAG: TIM barrel protein [Ginsengibacter sp.]